MLGRMIFGVLVLAASALLVWQVFFSASGSQEPPAMRAEQVEQALDEPYALRDWEQGEPSRLNISVFTFRDNNRNGRYDLGDLPMASVAVDLFGSDGERIRESSNINGYANFKMALDNPEHPINQADQQYRFEVLPPPGWQVSSANRVQEVQFERLPGSVAGLIARPAPQWVGLLPELYIKGRLLMAGEEALPHDLRVELVDDQQQTVRVEVAENGEIRAAVAPGRWLLQLSSDSLGWQLHRPIRVTSVPVELMPVTVGAVAPAPQPVLLLENFDWLQRSVIDKIPNGHLGLEWDYLLAVDNQEYRGPGYVNGLVSGHAVAYNSSGHPVTIAAAPGQVFDFVGGYFSVAWPRAHGEELDVVAWRQGEEVLRHALKLSYLGAVWLDADVRGIDRLTLSTRHYWQFVVDDMQFRLQPAG